ncbi:Fanconi anemia group C protein-like [Saccoglossus kowalevskii]|uniref:Fanconi anemia group C protein-like n=1 Tax=Saccoglossus kowalevskii TaxID=10224 RepID=A0ABM0MRS7_SACKO|nr:PREDICTED: Fanconi anemia group C protein-like [Saccoglossus kowalevskii]
METVGPVEGHDYRNISQEVDNWLERVKRWGQVGTVFGDHHQEIDASREEMECFLHQLHNVLSRWKDTSYAVQQLPNVGQLLGRLCCDNVVLLKESTYKILMQCILVLTSEQPKNELEEKANKWAYSQVKNTVSYVVSEKPYGTATEISGNLPDDFNQLAIVKLIDSIQSDLDSQHERKWSSKTNCLLPQRSLLNKVLEEVSNMCISLIDLECTLPLITALLCCHSLSDREEFSSRFLTKVTQSQKFAYLEEEKVISLSYNARVHLWLRFFPSLEQEICNLIDVLVVIKPYISPKDTIRLIESRQLPLACAENPAIYWTVNRLLRSMYIKCDGDKGIVRVLCMFHRAFMNSVKAHNTEPRFELSGFYPRVLQPLIHLMQIQPAGLLYAACNFQIQQICNILHKVREKTAKSSELLDIWLSLMQFSDWYYKAIELCLMMDCDVDDCLDYVCWLTSPFNYDTQKHCKEILKEILSALKVLKFKVYLQSCDLHYALTATNQVKLMGHMTSIMQSLLVLFFLKSVGGHLIAMEIIDLAFPCSSIAEKLSRFMDLTEIFSSLSGNAANMQHLSSNKIKSMHTIVSELRSCLMEKMRSLGSRSVSDAQLIERCDEFILSLQQRK